MEIKITLEGLVLFIAIVAIILITIYIVKTLINLNNLLKNVNNFLEENRRNLNETLKNVNVVTASAKDKIEYVDKFFKSDEEVAASTDFSDIISTVQSVVDLFRQIKDIFPKKKRFRR
ncbi:MAG: hypothetical protein N2448_08090 [Caloramator sp.]|nr:hypothetical protein [Caloramator sp.]